ncbi:MAG: hypothetical protein MK212_11750 [Saprospiraceae bacterium]|nr:hypothetical protein [Saprospiraceae bacterium]
MKFIIVLLFCSTFLLISCSKESDTLSTIIETNQIEGMSKEDDLPNNPVNEQEVVFGEPINLCYSPVGD